MNQVLTVENRHARIILEGAVHQIKIITSATHRWVGMKTRQYRIAEPLRIARQSHHHDCYDNTKLLHNDYLIKFMNWGRSSRLGAESPSA